MKTILHPTDFSPASRPAFKKAIEVAKKDRATLTLLHVMAPMVPAGNLYISPRTYDEWAAATTESANKAMGGLLKRARGAALKPKSIVLMGIPADVIVRTAWDWHRAHPHGYRATSTHS